MADISPNTADAKLPPSIWAVPEEDRRIKLGYFDRSKLQKKSVDKIKSADIWVAGANPDEAKLNAMVQEVCTSLNISKVPKLAIFKSDRPEIIDINKKHIGISTNMLEILEPDQLKAAMTQKLEARNHRVSNWLTKWIGSVVIAFVALAPVEYLIGKRWPQYSATHNLKRIIGHIKYELGPKLEEEGLLGRMLRKIKAEPLTEEQAHEVHKNNMISGSVLGVAKLVLLFPIERWQTRRHEKQQDVAAAKLTGTDAMAGALGAIGRREQELESHGVEPTKWIKRITPHFLSDTPSAEDRIANLRKKGPQSVTERSAASAGMSPITR